MKNKALIIILILVVMLEGMLIFTLSKNDTAKNLASEEVVEITPEQNQENGLEEKNISPSGITYKLGDMWGDFVITELNGRWDSKLDEYGGITQVKYTATRKVTVSGTLKPDFFFEMSDTFFVNDEDKHKLPRTAGHFCPDNNSLTYSKKEMPNEEATMTVVLANFDVPLVETEACASAYIVDILEINGVELPVI